MILSSTIASPPSPATELHSTGELDSTAHKFVLEIYTGGTGLFHLPQSKDVYYHGPAYCCHSSEFTEDFLRYCTVCG